jgi:ABC-2 type transport system permease protein
MSAGLSKKESALPAHWERFKEFYMYNFWVQSISTYKGLFYWLNWQGYTSGVFLQPFATVIMFAVLGRYTSNPDMVRSYILGIAVSGMAFIIIAGLTQGYTRERSLGGTQFLFVSTANRLVNFISRSVFHYPNGLISFAVGMLAAWLIVDLNFGLVDWGGFILSTLVISLSITAYGQLLGILSVATRDWIGIQGLGNGIILIFSGMIIPITAFPDFIQAFSRILPATNGLFAMRATFSGASLSSVSGDIIREFITGLVYYVIAFAAFVYFERRVKRTGTLERDAI